MQVKSHNEMQKRQCEGAVAQNERQSRLGKFAPVVPAMCERK